MRGSRAVIIALVASLVGCAPSETAHVRAKPEMLVAKMGHRAALLARLGQKPYAIHGQVVGRSGTSLTLSWSEPPPPIPYDMMLDGAYVTYGDEQGVEAMGAWCSAPTGKRTPMLCARAQETAAQDYLTHKY